MAVIEKPVAVSRRRFYFWLLAGVGIVALLWPLDNRVDAALDVTRNPALHHFAWWCSKIGEGWVIAVWALVFAALFVFMDRPRWAANVFFAGMTSLLAGLACVILRLLFGRARPMAHERAHGRLQRSHDAGRAGTIPAAHERNLRRGFNGCRELGRKANRRVLVEKDV